MFEVSARGDLGPFATGACIRPLTVILAVSSEIVVLVAGVGFLLHQAVPGTITVFGIGHCLNRCVLSSAGLTSLQNTTSLTVKIRSLFSSSLLVPVHSGVKIHGPYAGLVRDRCIVRPSVSVNIFCRLCLPALVPIGLGARYPPRSTGRFVRCSVVIAPNRRRASIPTYIPRN